MQQKSMVSPFWRRGVQDQGIGSFGFFWGLAPWHVDGPLLPLKIIYTISPHPPGPHTWLYANPLLRRTLVILDQGPPPMTSFQLIHLFKECISKDSHILSRWELGLYHMNFGGHKSSHNTHQQGMRVSVIPHPYWHSIASSVFLIFVILVVCKTRCCFNVTFFFFLSKNEQWPLCVSPTRWLREGQGRRCSPMVTNQCASPVPNTVPLVRVQESTAGLMQNFHHSLQNDLRLIDVRSSHIVGIKEELWKHRTLGRGWWFQLPQDNTKEGQWEILEKLN